MRALFEVNRLLQAYVAWQQELLPASKPRVGGSPYTLSFIYIHPHTIRSTAFTATDASNAFL